MLVYEAVADYLAEARKLSGQALKAAIVKAGEGDPNAFTQLYTEFTPLLKTVARAKARGGAVSDVDDIVQTVFVKFYEKELKKVAKLIASGKKDVGYLVALLKRSTLNATVDANRAAGKRGMTGGRSTDIDPAGALTGRDKHLGAESRKVVRAAFQRALKSPKLKKDEREYIQALFSDGPEGFAVPTHGNTGEIQKKLGIKSARGTKIKTKFLKLFCNDKELCALLPRHKGRLGRARDISKGIPGLAKAGNVCKGVGVCTEFFWRLTGDHFLVEDEGTAEDLVLSWLMGVLLQGD